MTIIDSSVWIDALRGISSPQTEWLRRFAKEEDLGLTDLILCEVLQGVRHNSSFEAFRKDLLRFSVFETGGVRLAVDAAKNYRLLRDQGITVRSTVDCVVATFCIDGGHAMLHRDRDYDGFERHLGLKVIHP